VFYFVSISVFTSIVLTLVLVLLFVEAKVVIKGDCQISINKNDKTVSIQSGNTLLAGLAANEIFLPSACGGSGSCAQCKCKVLDGGGDILPTELPHLSRIEKKDNIRLSCQLKVKNDLSIEIPAEIFSIKKYDATVMSNKNVATFIKELILKLDHNQELDFTAGAYIQIDIPEYEVSFTQFDIADKFTEAWDRFNLRRLHASADEPVFRAYSLASPPSEKKELRFTVRIATPPLNASDIPPGIGSSYVFSLEPGDKVVLSGPYGDFFVQNTDREMCFIGGGAGMAPMRCHILHQLNTVKTKRKMTFWYGARSKQEMFYDEEFKTLDKKNRNFSYYVSLSDPQPEDKWNGHTGFIHQVLYDNYLKEHNEPDEIEYYLCGPPMMLDAILEMLDNLGVEPEMIRFDKF